jgi:DNA-binding NtrC family response regulator
VDDEPFVLKSLAATLRKHFEVISASGAAEALELLEHDPELRVIVSDYRMPGMDGRVFLARARERFPSVIRILLSGAGAENVVIDEPDLVFRFLSKPCPRETLVQVIDDALARQPRRRRLARFHPPASGVSPLLLLPGARGAMPHGSCLCSRQMLALAPRSRCGCGTDAAPLSK